MKTIYVFIGFMVIALIQIFIPSQMIWQQEDVLTSGKAYKFKTRPIDPSDPFRGKYITLDYDMNSFAIADSSFVYGDKILIYIEKDSTGFAKAIQVSKKPLANDRDYVVAKVTDNYNEVVNFELPFDRFYMEESKAKDAERAYIHKNTDSLKENVYALVHVKDGRSVLKDVIIDGISIQDYVEK